MRVPLSWLRDFVPVKASPSVVAERLTMAGIDVERVTDRSKDYERCVVGEIVQIKPHPNADTLLLAYVVTTTKGTPQEIVCGAHNIAVGQKVPVALVGATLPNGLKIEPRKIRGVVSYGMLCSEDELGLGSDHTEIVILDSTLSVGTPLIKALGFDDVVFDVAIPANRADLLSVRGIAWEVAAVFNARFRDTVVTLTESATAAKESVGVNVVDTKLCPRYIARVIRGVRVGSSPLWLQSRLRRAGVRPINAIVDATNYAMLEYGQPLHAFDIRKVYDGRIIVRPAKTGEHLRTLDGKDRELDPSVLVIADPKGPIALAGIMGGAESEITAGTTDIILESAIFDPVSIRKTSRAQGLRSESSLRFEKGISWRLPDAASKAAAALIVKLCGGRVEKGTASVGTTQPKPIVVAIKPSYFSEVLGMDVRATRARQFLTRLGFKVKGTARSWNVTVPSWRLDVKLPEDLVDEVGRMIGYEDLRDELPNFPYAPLPIPELIELKDRIRDVLVGFGFTETMSHAFYGKPWAATVGGEHFEIANPLDSSQQFLRRSIVPQLYTVLTHAADEGNDASVFEIGRVFLKSSSRDVPPQPWKLSLGMCFKAGNGYVRGRKLRGVVEQLFDALGVREHDIIVSSSDRKGRILEWCELDSAAMRDWTTPIRFQPLRAYPAVYRDISFWVPETRAYRELEHVVEKAGQPLLESVELFDVFEKSGRRSYALHLAFRAPDRTLTNEEISAKMKAITAQLQALGAELR